MFDIMLGFFIGLFVGLAIARKVARKYEGILKQGIEDINGVLDILEKDTGKGVEQ